MGYVLIHDDFAEIINLRDFKYSNYVQEDHINIHANYHLVSESILVGQEANILIRPKFF